MAGNLTASVTGQIITIQNQTDTKNIEIINRNLLRIFKTKNSEELVKLHYNDIKENVELHVEKTADGILVSFDLYQIFADENLNISIQKDGQPYFEEYTGDASIYVEKKEFSLAELEGHKHEETLAEFKTQINITLFDKEDKIYGLGDKAAQLNKRDYEYVSWNTDDPSQHNETYKSLYKSINYLLVNHHQDKYYGIFYPSSFKCIFNIGRYSDKFMYIGSEKGEYDYFVLLGETPMEITKVYASLVGHTLFTPRKMLGYHQSRWSYNAQEMEEIREKFKKYQLPIDYIHLDIDYMERYKVYTVKKEEFPDLKGMAEQFAQDGIDFITIIDPGVKVEDGYDVYEYLKEHDGFATLNGEQYINQVWPGDSKYPNYFKTKTADYITDITKTFMADNHVKGIWCDMNEPASFNGPLPDDVEFPSDTEMHYHEEVHNLYGEYMSRAIAKAFEDENKRPVVITRAAFATTSPFSTTWNGDNQSLWSHLEASLPQVMTMNICNFAVNGVDIGGFGNETTKELLIRWMEANMFSLFLRNHSSLHTRKQEPYAFDGETIQIYKKMLDLRYEFLPYLYDLLENAHTTGVPAQRPLFFNYPADERTKQINDEVMIGDNVLFAPVVRQGQVSRAVYLPAGTWVNYFTKEVYEGGKEYLVEMPLDATGIFIKAGAIVPMYKNLLHIENKNLDTLYLYVEQGADGEYIHYEDDGESLDYRKAVYNRYKITKKGNTLTFHTIEDNYTSSYKEIVILSNGKEIKVTFAKDFECELN